MKIRSVQALDTNGFLVLRELVGHDRLEVGIAQPQLEQNGESAGEGLSHVSVKGLQVGLELYDVLAEGA